MSAPAQAINRWDLGLTYAEFSLAMNQKKFIGLQVLPPIGVSQEASSFLRLNVASFLTKPEDTERAPKSTYSRSDYEWDSDSYAVSEHGVEEVVDDATVERYGDIVRAEFIAVMRGVNRVLQKLEQDIADAVFNTSTWTGASLTTPIGTAWTDKANCDPVADVDGAREKVKANCGMTPNAVVMTDTDFLNAIRSDRIEGLLKYDAMQVLMAMQGQQDAMVVRAAAGALAGLFDVDKVLIGQGFKNSADQGQTVEFSRFWTAGRVMVCHVNDDGMMGDLEAPVPNIGRTIFSTKNSEPLPGAEDTGEGSLLFDEYRDEPVRGSVFRPRNKRQVKILHEKAGHLLTGAS